MNFINGYSLGIQIVMLAGNISKNIQWTMPDGREGI